MRGRFSSRKLIALIFLGLLGVGAVIAASAIVLVATIDLRPLVEQYMTKALDRRLTIGSLRIGWSNPLSVEISDLRLANAPGGSDPEMVRIERLSADIDLRSLFSGALHFDKLDIVKPRIILERDADGIGNWRFSRVASVPPLSATLVPGIRVG